MTPEKFDSSVIQPIRHGGLESAPSTLLAYLLKSGIESRTRAERKLVGPNVEDESRVRAAFNADASVVFTRCIAALLRGRGKSALRALERHGVGGTGQRRKRGLTLDPRKIDMHPSFLAEIESEHPFGGTWKPHPTKPGHQVLVFDKPADIKKKENPT